MPIRKTLDHHFFSSWGANMAYVLGFFAADGTMVHNRRGAHFIEFQVTDRMLLRDVRRLLGSNHRIGVRTRNPKWKVGYRLQVGSKTMFEDLTRLGFTPNKSNTLQFPAVPREFLGHYMRGYLDGDGCVYFKRHIVKGRSKPKWIFQVRFTCGSRSYLEALVMRLRFEKYVRGGYIVNKVRGYELVFSHRDGLALYGLMYNNAGTNFVYLARKKKIYDKAMVTLFGMRV